MAPPPAADVADPPVLNRAVPTGYVIFPADIRLESWEKASDCISHTPFILS